MRSLTLTARGLRPVHTAPARADLVAEELRRAILQGELAPGTALIERDIGEALGVSKTPVREAIKTLVARGLIDVSPYRGATVRRVDATFATHVYEVRLLLEPEAARLAAKRRPAEDIEDARRALGRAETAVRNRDFGLMAAHNRDFHQAFAVASGNPVLGQMLAGLQDQTTLVATQGWKRHESWTQEASEHLAVLEAIEAGDAAAAGHLMHAHIESALARLKTAFSKHGSGQ